MLGRFVTIGALLAAGAAALVIGAGPASATPSYCIDVNGPNGGHITTVCVPLP